MTYLKILSLIAILLLVSACGGDKKSKKNGDLVISGSINPYCQPVLTQNNGQYQDPNIQSILMQVAQECQVKRGDQNFMNRLMSGTMTFAATYSITNTQQNQYNQYNQFNQLPYQQQGMTGQYLYKGAIFR